MIYIIGTRKDKKNQKKSKKKSKKKEEEEIELNQQTIFVNNKSKILLSRKSRTSSKNYNDTNNLGNVIVDVSNNNMNEKEDMNQNVEVAFDLWPNYLERKYYDEKEEIPLPDKNNENEFNHLDFIGNKEENKIRENDEEESEDNDDNEEDNYNEGYNNYHNINSDEE